MLVEFSVQNFLSIKDKVTFSMEPTTDIKINSNIFKHKKDNVPDILSLAVIYGANASGKSNFLNAFSFISYLVQTSHTFQPETRIQVTPFKFDSKTMSAPTSMEIIFINEGNKYRYGFTMTSEKILNEYLFMYHSRKPSMIFERKRTNDYKFTKDVSFQEDISKKTNKNSLYLSTSAQWNYEPSQRALNWFEEHLVPLVPGMFHFGQNRTCEMILEDNKTKETILKALQSADLGIFGVEVTEKQPLTINKDLPIFFGTLSNMIKGYNIKFAHQGLKDGYETTVHLDIEEESGGTKKFFQMIGHIIESLHEGDTLVIDEFDTTIHPLLLKKIMMMFLDHELNKKGAQLIFATHATSLLDSDILRRDQIWFTEKKIDGGTDLFSLADFTVRKDANFEKGYILGRYGAIPYLSSGNLI